MQEAVHSPVSRRTLAVHVHGNPKQPLEQAAGVPNAESSHVSNGSTAAAPTGEVLRRSSANSLRATDCPSYRGQQHPGRMMLKVAQSLNCKASKILHAVCMHNPAKSIAANVQRAGADVGGAAEHGHREPVMSGGSPADPPGVAQQQRREIISDPWAFKRSLEMWSSPV